MPPAATRDWPVSLLTAARLVSFAVVCGVLFWGQVVLIPIALAALITFLLSPLVSLLDGRRVPRTLAVLLVVGLATSAFGSMGYVVFSELTTFAAELPAYRQNIRTKVNDLRNFTRGGAIENVQTAIEDISQQVDAAAGPDAPAEPLPEQAAPATVAPPPANAAPSNPPAPVPVQVVPEPRLFGDVGTWTPALGAAATFGLTMLLAIFMLIWREDLRNRVVSLAGATSIVITTKAVAEAGLRISRYLQMQLLINATMGVAVGVGLYVIGVPYAPLWGFAAAVFRYVPYVGPWVAAVLPITVSLVTTPGWEQVLLVLVLFGVLELLSNNVMEPLLYGHSVGLSPLAVVVSAIFWTWIWGPVGLVLATPLTVCLVVFSKDIPGLAMFDRLLSDRPALESELLLYQRLLSRDEDGAEAIVEQHLAEQPLTETCEQLLLGALVALKRDLDAHRISTEEGDFVANGLREMLDDVPVTIPDDKVPARSKATARVIGFPVRDTIDEVALHILRVLMRSERCEFEVLSADLLFGERIDAVQAQEPAAVCIVGFPPGDLAVLRHTCKRIRALLPKVQLIVGRLGLSEMPARSTELLHAAGATQVCASLAEVHLAARSAAHSVLSTDATPSADEPEVPTLPASASA